PHPPAPRRARTRRALTPPGAPAPPPPATAPVAGIGLRAIPPERPDTPKEGKGKVELAYRNITEADVKVYPVDLMRLYLTRRNLDGIAGIDLAGIRPLHEAKVTLGKGEDFAEKIRTLDLPLAKEGAYLVMVRGDDLYASGIVLVSPLEREAVEDAGAGRVRVTVRDARSKEFVPKAQVKVIGSDNPTFLGGSSDLRGVVLTEGVRGVVTAVARRGSDQYAFYRGITPVGAPPAAPARAEAPGAPGGGQPSQTLEQNLRNLNFENQSKQIERLQERYKVDAPAGVQVQGVK